MSSSKCLVHCVAAGFSLMVGSALLAQDAPKKDAPVEQAPEEKGAEPAIAKDGYPTGNTAAVGVACDMARAFIEADAEVFRKACLDPKDARGASEEYQKFLDMVAKSMARVKERGLEAAGGPKNIAKLYKARHMTMSGPASAGYAIFEFNDVQFVDVLSELHSGGSHLNRTLVVQLEDDTWRAIPNPSLFEMLSVGLNDEADSTEEWSKPE